MVQKSREVQYANAHCHDENSSFALIHIVFPVPPEIERAYYQLSKVKICNDLNMRKLRTNDVNIFERKYVHISNCEDFYELSLACIVLDSEHFFSERTCLNTVELDANYLSSNFGLYLFLRFPYFLSKSLFLKFPALFFSFLCCFEVTMTRASVLSES